MLESVLFFGFKVDDDLNAALAGVSPPRLIHFISEGSAYLHEVVQNDTRYIGKMLTPIEEVASLESLQANIVSIVSKLIPDFNPSHYPMVLFAVARKPSSDLS